jgi:hypothetical protein
MLEILASANLRPFSIAGGLVVGLLLMEILLMLIGVSTQIGDPDVDLDFDVDVDVTSPDIANALDGIDSADMANIEPVWLDMTDTSTPVDTLPEAPGFFMGVFDFLGITKVATAIWLAGLMAFISIFGFVGQGILKALGLGYLPGGIALGIVAIPALLTISKYSHLLGRLIPNVETTAVSSGSFHRRRGIVTGGTARFNMPAEVKWIDGHGNSHYLRAEPLSATLTIDEGTEVLILKTRDNKAKIININ